MRPQRRVSKFVENKSEAGTFDSVAEARQKLKIPLMIITKMIMNKKNPNINQPTLCHTSR